LPFFDAGTHQKAGASEARMSKQQKSKINMSGLREELTAIEPIKKAVETQQKDLDKPQ
jgi:hypothetical protein